MDKIRKQWSPISDGSRQWLLELLYHKALYEKLTWIYKGSHPISTNCSKTRHLKSSFLPYQEWSKFNQKHLFSITPCITNVARGACNTTKLLIRKHTLNSTVMRHTVCPASDHLDRLMLRSSSQTRLLHGEMSLCHIILIIISMIRSMSDSWTVYS